mmetsp:Transcript_4213/g.5931  ORF Transcript_4213/g.5931 Transcript_4213/m.5931 type:complete len:84 (-) Transcript_4213:242-493(-)
MVILLFFTSTLVAWFCGRGTCLEFSKGSLSFSFENCVYFSFDSVDTGILGSSIFELEELKQLQRLSHVQGACLFSLFFVSALR